MTQAWGNYRCGTGFLDGEELEGPQALSRAVSKQHPNLPPSQKAPNFTPDGPRHAGLPPGLLTPTFTAPCLA